MNRSTTATWLAIAISLWLGWVPGCKDQSPPPLAARFDYTMPARFAVPDLQAPEEGYEAYVAGDLHPDVWVVRLDGCPSTGSIVRYTWSIDGVEVGTVSRCSAFEYPFPVEGAYSVGLVVEDEDGDVASRTQDIVVDDLLIFGVGDSYASGEGNPDVELSLAAAARVEEARAEAADAEAVELASAQWQNRRCHRSAHSGQVRAARQIENADRHTSVTFVHLACSGARVHEGLLGGYLGVEAEEPPLPPQIERVEEIADGREIDALVVSIGGNDVNFADIIEACILGEDCHEDPAQVDPALSGAIDLVCPLTGPFESDCVDYFDELLAEPVELDAKYVFDVHSVAQDVNGVDVRQDGNDDLPDNYRDLADAIADLPGMGPDAQQGRVYLTEVPDVTRNQNGVVCGWDTMPLLNAIVYQLPLISQAELTWASDYVTVELRRTMRNAASEHGWHFVEGISSAFRRHGYCATVPWVVRLQNSFRTQGDYNGVVHPNVDGHGAYASAIARAIQP
jgi:hypothetical protein